MHSTTSTDGLWIRFFQAAASGQRTVSGQKEPSSGVRLVCLPHAGGSASYFLPLARALAPSVQVLAVQYPGRQDRHTERCLDDMAELADGVVTALMPLVALKPSADAPFAIFGHSLGAVLAFEVARRFEQDFDIVPRHLFVSGREAPSRPPAEYGRPLGDRDLLAEMQLLDGTDDRFLRDEELLRMVMPAIRADYRVLSTYVYRPGPKLTCPITVLTGDQDPKATPDGTRAWRDHTSGAFDYRVFVGGHFYLGERQSEVVEAVLDHLDEKLDQKEAP
jgi:surfactin synthase thioesterase subunit